MMRSPDCTSNGVLPFFSTESLISARTLWIGKKRIGYEHDGTTRSIITWNNTIEATHQSRFPIDGASFGPMLRKNAVVIAS